MSFWRFFSTDNPIPDLFTLKSLSSMNSAFRRVPLPEFCFSHTTVNYRSLMDWGPKSFHPWNIFHYSKAHWFISSVTQLYPTLCDPMDCSIPGFPVHHQLPELTQTHVHPVRDAIQPSHPLSSPSPLAFNHSQHQGLFQWVSSLHQVAKVLEFQLQHQSFQWIFRTDFL